ncbi:hypothetical protein U3516DRAFT_761778 [Neocallimastix sp. 'constans']
MEVTICQRSIQNNLKYNISIIQLKYSRMVIPNMKLIHSNNNVFKKLQNKIKKHKILKEEYLTDSIVPII